MLNPLWSEPPDVEVLQWLARGDLKQKLLQAVRLWVWLHFLYGETDVQLNLPEKFSYADWRTAFFSPTHTKGEEKPALHDPNCRCAKTPAAWLFGANLNLTPLQWEVSASKDCQLVQQEKQFEQSLREHHALPENLPQLLHNSRLFGLTRRALAADLQVLVDIQWLKRSGHQYYRVSDRPLLPLDKPSRKADRLIAYNLEFLTQPDLAAIADNLSVRLNGQQRFFIHLEYVIPPDRIDAVEEWQAQLRELWQQTVIPPILLTYQSAGQTTFQLVVYPVCIYYYQRGPYLCAFGEIPQSETQQLDWRNYRLDRLHQLIPLSWDDPQVPVALKQRCKTHIPTTEDVQLLMAEVWGFDYYQQPQQLLLRFDREWDDRYIQNTVRHATFERVDYQEVGQIIQKTLKGKQQQAMLTLWCKRSPQDAYYQAQYRQGDPNVMQRLRAWRPRIEILLPWELRQQAAREVQQEWKLYE